MNQEDFKALNARNIEAQKARPKPPHQRFALRTKSKETKIDYDPIEGEGREKMNKVKEKEIYPDEEPDPFYP